MRNIIYRLWAADTKIKMSWCCLVVGIFISIFCLCEDPRGEISDSALWAVGQFLALAGALLGVYAQMDYKNKQLANYVDRQLDKKQDKTN